MPLTETKMWCTYKIYANPGPNKKSDYTYRVVSQ